MDKNVNVNVSVNVPDAHAMAISGHVHGHVHVYGIILGCTGKCEVILARPLRSLRKIT